VNEQAPAFFAEREALMWSGEPSAVEDWAYSDGLIALVIGGVVFLAAVVGSLAIALASVLGGLTR